MKNYRLFILLLSIVTIVFFFAACSNEKVNNTANNQEKIKTEEEQQVTSGTQNNQKEPVETSKKTNNNTKDVDKESNFDNKQKQEEGVKEKSDSVKLRITKSFGREVLINKKIPMEKDWTVYDALDAVAEIKTSYGGAFIKSINGLESRYGGFGSKKEDWMYYVNGIFSDVGAVDYPLKAGGIVWWDYHSWQQVNMFSAVIGCYPEPFINGYRGNAPTAVLHTGESKKQAAAIKKALRAHGVSAVNIHSLNNQSLKNCEGPVIAVGQWSKLNQVKYLANLNKAYRKSGTAVHFTGEGLELLNSQFKAARKISGTAGVIIASGKGSGDESPLWIVSGTDREGLQQAVDVLVNTPDKISGLYSAAIKNGEVIRLPLIKNNK